MASAEELQAKGIALVDQHTALFRIWAEGYLGDMKALEAEITASGLSKADQRKLSLAIVKRADGMTNMEF